MRGSADPRYHGAMVMAQTMGLVGQVRVLVVACGFLAVVSGQEPVVMQRIAPIAKAGVYDATVRGRFVDAQGAPVVPEEYMM